jgi:GTP-binding protein Era
VDDLKKSGIIAIAGRPNSGKSTLLNRVMSTELSIVSPKAQTTRERVLGILSEKEGQIVFIDTPGIHNAKDGGINEFMMNEVREALEGASAIWYLVDPSSAIYHESRVIELLKAAGNVPVFLIFNKMDLNKSDEATQLNLVRFEEEIRQKAVESGLTVRSVHQISALKGKGVGELLAQTWSILPEGPALYPDEEQLSDRPVKFFVAEKIRQQLLRQLGEEVPYSCAVKVETFKENVKPVRIEASIFVERDSQKSIVIGAAGSKIKAIGTAARGDIEEFLDQKIFLGLQVKVLKDWSRDKNRLKDLGYAL